MADPSPTKPSWSDVSPIGLLPDALRGCGFSGMVRPRSQAESMNRKRFMEEEIAFALLRAENCVAVRKVCRKLQITEQTFHRWKKKFAGMGVSEVRRLKQFEKDVSRWKQLVADLSLEKAMLEDVPGKGPDA